MAWKKQSNGIRNEDFHRLPKKKHKETEKGSGMKGIKKIRFKPCQDMETHILRTFHTCDDQKGK